MAAELKAKISLDVNPFEKGLQKAQAAAGRAADGIAGRFKGLGAPLTGAFAAVSAGLTGNAIAGGVADIIKAGGALVDLSDQTGISVRNLVILEKRFTDAGLSAEDAASATGKMQKYLEEIAKDSTKHTRIHELGLSVASLMAMKPEQQLEAIGKAVGRIESPSARAAAAMEIFGKSGAKLNRVFQGDIFDNVSAGLAKRADFMAKNAKLFDEVSDKLIGPAGVLKSFYAGVADSVTPALSGVVDALKKIDLVGVGQSFGTSVVGAATALLKAAKVVKDSGLIQNGAALGSSIAGTGVAQAGVKLAADAAGGAAHIIRNRGVSADEWEYTRRGMFGRNRRADGSRMTLEEMRERDGEGAPKKAPPKAGAPPEDITMLPVDRYYDYGVNGPNNSVLPQWNDFYANKPRSLTSFADKLKPTLQGALTPNMAKRLEMSGLYDGAGNTLLGKSPTGLNVDTAEAFRRRQKGLFDDAQYADPNAKPEVLNARVNAQMRQAEEQRKADAFRANVDALRKPDVGEAAAQTESMSDTMQGFFDTLEELIGKQTEALQQTVAQ